MQRSYRRRVSGGVTNTVRANIPPAAQLFARSTNTRYVLEINTINDHQMGEGTPITLATVRSPP